MSIGPWQSYELKVEQLDLDDVFADMVRVAQCHRQFSRAGQVILVYCNGRTLRAVARGMYSNRTGVIAMDERCRDILGLQPGDKAEFQFVAADFFDEVIWALKATDAMPRIAAQLGVLSVVLGLIGLLLGCVSIAL